MAKSVEIALYEANEFFFENMHFEPGWYFRDEEGYPYGPFVDKAHCERGFVLYLRQLEKGEAPTQLDGVPILRN